MGGHHFICYSTIDGSDAAQRLYAELKNGQPAFSAWLDKHDIRPGRDWDEQVVEAIRSCASLLFLMSTDSVEPQSVCKQEWSRALQYKKPIIPLLLEPEAEMPFRLGSRQYLDFSGDFEAAINKLRQHFQWLTSSEGVLQSLQDRLADAQRDLRRAPDAQTGQRIQDEIDDLTRQIQEQEQLIGDPQGAAQRVADNIQRGLERERRPADKPQRKTSRKFINPPPAIAPSYFQNRFIETGLVVDFLRDPAKRLMTVIGRGGVGKTAMVCRILKSLEQGELPDDHGSLSLAGIVYLSSSGSRRVNFSNLFADLLKLLPEAKRQSLESLAKDPRAAATDKLAALLNQLPEEQFVVLLDNFEDLIDPQTHNIGDGELDEALRALLTLPHHGVKILLTTRVAPRDLTLLEPARQSRIDLDQGLESPYAENILQAMDVDGKLGLKTASPALLVEARQRTLGFPRALEALFAILSADRHTSLEEVLQQADQALPENVVEVLVGEAFNRLDATVQRIMQALAIYAQPVHPTAVDYLLQPFLPGIDSAPILNRLVSMHFVRKETGCYFLHPVDRSYALQSIPSGQEADRQISDRPPFSQFALLHRGAEYFRQARKPREAWKSSEDLRPQLAEFELRCNGGDYACAAEVLLEIDFNYLMIWGDYQQTARMHERLRGKLADLWLQQNSYGNLGTAYYWMGRYPESIASYEKALQAARSASDSWGESAWLGSLANCYGELGQTPRALEYYRQALALARQLGDPRIEAPHINNIGYYLVDIGQNAQARDHHQQALEISRENDDPIGESIHIANLGIRTHELGQTDQGIEYCETGLAMAQKAGYRYSESVSLTYLGDIFLDQGEYTKALEYYQAALKISIETSNIQFRDLAEWGLSLTHLCLGHLSEASRFVAEAISHEVPRTNYAGFALQGLISLRQGSQSQAQESFSRAIGEAEQLLEINPQNSRALDFTALALCGLGLLQAKPAQLSAATQAFEGARAICRDPGPIRRMQRLLDELAKCPNGDWLAEVRSGAAGE